MNNFYTYVYLDPRKSGIYNYGEYEFDYEPFYVGKGKGNRWNDIKWSRNKYFKNKINKIKRLGFEPIRRKIKENLEENYSFEIEKELIKLIGKEILKEGPLTNETDGGEGSSGYIHTEETLEKLKKNFSEIKKDADIKNCRVLTEEKDYKNTHQKLDYICKKENHKFSMRQYHFQQGKGCPYCARKINAEKRKKHFPEIKKEFENIKCILKTEEKDYKNAFTKLEYICDKGHEHSIKWNDFQQGHKCPYCFNELRSKKMRGKNSILIAQNIIEIKLLLKEGKLMNKEIADIFEISTTTVSEIKNNKRFNHIKI